MPIANLPVILTTNTVVKPFTMMVKARHTFVAHRTVLAFGTSVQETEKKYYQWWLLKNLGMIEWAQHTACILQAKINIWRISLNSFPPTMATHRFYSVHHNIPVNADLPHHRGKKANNIYNLGHKTLEHLSNFGWKVEGGGGKVGIVRTVLTRKCRSIKVTVTCENTLFPAIWSSTTSNFKIAIYSKHRGSSCYTY